MLNSAAGEKNDTYAEILGTAERLFDDIGFRKTTVADIAHKLQMSPANIYRFFTSKAEINTAVCGELLGKIEVASQAIARSSSGPASETLRKLIASIESLNSLRFQDHRNLHELVHSAYEQNWSVVHEHSKRMEKILENLIRHGMVAGEFRAGDAELSAIAVVCACLRFFHPRLSISVASPVDPAARASTI